MANITEPDIIMLNRVRNKGKDELASLLESMAEQARNGELDCFILAGYDNNNEVVMAKGNITSISEEQTLVGALQTMVMFDLVEGLK